jgi:transcriptional regulator with XRE-family HTH domain
MVSRPPTFGTLLRRHRRAAGLTQEALAERAGLGTRSIQHLEHGDAHVPRPDTVRLLAEALGLAPGARARFEAAARGRGPTPDDAVHSSGAPGALLVGRNRECALLERHLADEGPPLLVLAGEPGVGKTRLLGVAAARAAARGLPVLEGGCQRRGGQAPYAPLLAALQGYLRRQAPAQHRANLRGCAWRRR